MQIKNGLKAALAAALMLILCLAGGGTAGADEKNEEAEWTVMFYFCGADLESKYGYASDNIMEIMTCMYPMQDILFDDDSPYSAKQLNASPGRVNILVETGGAKEWHGITGSSVAFNSGALQRWQCIPNYILGAEESGLFLLEEVPLRNMADPESLTDFIRWGAATCPAKKYMLVLWGHGGAVNGLFIDELFGGDYMTLTELGDAMDRSGVQFEAVLFDACLMANIETAVRIQNSAKWMIASEELVPGNGTHITGWLQELINNPSVDGMQIGRVICDMTEMKYANSSDEQAQSTLTWSVIDLSRVNGLVQAIEKYLEYVCYVYESDPYFCRDVILSARSAESYNEDKEGMRDIGSTFYGSRMSINLPYAIRRDILNELAYTVVYNVHGSGRSESHGLSFCVPTAFDDEQIERYAQDCIMPAYLSLLDAITDWDLPEEEYERLGIRKLTKIGNAFEGHGVMEKIRRENGMPAIRSTGFGALIEEAYYRLYQQDEENGELSLLGRNACRIIMDGSETVFSAIDPGHWPAVEDVTACIEVVDLDSNFALYNIPISIGGTVWNLRCGRTYDRALLSWEVNMPGTESVNRYRIYGLWGGYDNNTQTPSRNTMPLSQMSGQEFQLLYPIEGSNESGQDVLYESSAPLQLFRSLEVAEKPLKPGTYYMQYEIADIFGRIKVLEKIEMYWDGEQWTWPDDLKWEGTFLLYEAQ